MAGPHHHGHHGHGGHGHGGGRRFGRGFDVVYVNDPSYCPPGWQMLPDGVGGWICRPIPSLQSAAGAGDIASNVAALTPTIDAVKLAWQNFDGRPFGAAVLSAYARAASKAWKNDLASKSDLTALCIASALDSRAIDDGTQVGRNAANILANTWNVLAKKTGYQGQSPADLKKTQGTQASVEIIIIVVAVLAMAGVYAWIIYKAAEIIETKLTIDAESEELVRLHAEGQKIVDRHLQDPTLPWTPEEIKMLDDLRRQQEGLQKQIGTHAPPPANPFDPAPYLLAGAAGLAAYFFFLRKRTT